MSGELESFFTSLPKRAAEKDLTGVRASYVFSVEGGDAWTVRIDGGRIEVTSGTDPQADCIISASEETFSKLIDRELSPLPAYMSGKLKLSGDLGAAMLLQKIL